MSIATDLRKVIMAQAEILKAIAEEELRKVIEDTIYSRPESDWYRRTGNFLAAVTSSAVEFVENTISFRVYIDPDKLHHYSIAGEEKKGIAPGDEVNISELLNQGHTGLGVVYKPTDFLNIYIQQIENDLNAAMIKYIIQKFNAKTYKK